MYWLILHGKRLVQLQNAYFSSVSHRRKIFTVSYLIESLGLTSQLAESISRKVCLEDKVNADSVLNLFRSHGFADSQISTIISDYPKLLIEDAEKSLAPKLQALKSKGASTSGEFARIVSAIPKILGKKEPKIICRYYDFVKEIMDADKSSEKKWHSLPEGSSSRQNNKLRNVSVLRELGMPQKLLFSLLISNFQPVHGKERFEESLKKVVEMGFDPTTSKFVEALHVFCKCSGKAIQEKVQVYKSLGFTEEDVWSMFRAWPITLRHSEKKIFNSFETFLGLGFTRDEFTMMVKCFPPCLNYTEEMVKKKTEFVVKTMNWPLKAVATFPQVISCSMEKRIIPRCEVIKALMSKRLIGSEPPSMSSVLTCTDQTFLKRYVVKHDDKLVLELMAIFTKARVS